MQLFISLLLAILPLYFLIGIGFIAGKYLHVQKESVARLLIYIIAPAVIFSGVVKAPFDAATIAIPFIFFGISTVVSFVVYKVSRMLFAGTEKNLLGYMAGTGNVGYFGLPVAIAVFGQGIMPLVTVSIIGFQLFENSVGVYIAARGNYSARESIRRIIKLPTIYAFILGIIVHIVNIPTNEWTSWISVQFQGAYTVLGMMLIGIGIASSKHIEFDIKFIASAFASKFLLYPALECIFIALDKTFFHWYGPVFHALMIFMSVTPKAANTVAFSTEFKIHPDKAATVVFLSTIFALFYIPLAVTVGGIHP